MASAGSRALSKMAAGGPARRVAGAAGRSRPETRGPELPGRQRPPRRCAKGSLEGGRPVTASAEPAGEAPPAVRRQERGGPRRPSPVGGPGPGRAGGEGCGAAMAWGRSSIGNSYKPSITVREFK